MARSRPGFLPHRRWLIMLGALSIVLSLLMPLVAAHGATTTEAAAAAQSEPPNCDPGFEPSEDGTTCVEDPNAPEPPPLECQPGTIPNEAGTECVPDPNAGPAQADPVYVLVRKYECPPGTDWYQATRDQFAGCSPNTTLVTFVVTAPDGLDWTRPVPGGSQWGPWTAGDVRIVEEVPAGYGNPVVFCGAAPTGEIPELSLLGATNQVDWSLTAGQTLTCDYYNIPDDGPGGTPVAGANDLQFYKYRCPPDLPRDADQDYYEQNCQPQFGVTFNLQHPGGDSGRTTDGGGDAAWSDLPIGNWTATESLPSGYGDPLVWCRWVAWPTEAGLNDDWMRYDAPGGIYHDSFGYEGMVRECHWYNFPPGEPAEDNENDYNYVDFYKHSCPTVPALATMGEDDIQPWLDRECGEYLDGWEFELQHADGGSTETTDSSGHAGWSGVSTGTWQATEAIPNGWGPPIVTCQYTEWPEGTNVWSLNSAPPDTTGSFSISYDMPFEGMRAECHWYNFPPGMPDEDSENDYNYVDFFKYMCPAAAPEGAGKEWYDQRCQPAAGWELTVQWDGDGSTRVTDASGYAGWSGLPTGTWTGTETLPPVFGPPVVWCRYTEWQDDSLHETGWLPFDVSGAEISGAFGFEGIRIECRWYNYPLDEPVEETGTDDNSVDFSKYLCPPDVPRDAEEGYYNLNCQPLDGVTFELQHTGGSSSQTTDASGYAGWSGLPSGDWTATETLPVGYDDPLVWCRWVEWPSEAALNGDWTRNDAPGGAYGDTFAYEGMRRECHWYNVESPVEQGRITIYKHQCAPGVTSTDLEALRQECAAPFDGVPFRLEYGGSTEFAATSGGIVDWDSLDPGSYRIGEQLLPGYEQPRAWCGYVLHDGDVIDPASQVFDSYSVTGGAIEVELTNVPAHLVCYWYNVPTDPGEITVYKWRCPPGYDVEAWGADPKTDCAIGQDGVTFTLDPTAGDNMVASTGDVIPGAVHFGDLSPGPYVITETAPADTAYTFVLDCTGTNIAKVHPTPLSWGSVLDVNVASGDTIICNWYNVPDPDNGWVTVHKYACWTPEFTSTVDCETWEHGTSFELFGYPDGTSYGAGATNAGGEYTWPDLPEGAYSISEIGQTPCKITSDKVDGEGNAWVDAGAGTVIKVYNCATSDIPGKAPGKYPNTGAGPAGEISRSSHQDTPAGAATPAAGPVPEDYYENLCLDDGDTADGTPGPTTPEIEATAPPIEVETTDTSEVMYIEILGTPAPESAGCERGAIPQRLVIDSAGVDHDVEILEIVDGVMQQPTGPDEVSWYKETGRLGEDNNVVIAGHLNWWNVPEGVFYHLQEMEAGDRIEIAGDDGATYVYEVEWVRQESNLAPPAAEVIGPTDEPSLTLITCGGEWDTSISEYDERTVVRAVQVEVIPAGN